MLFRKRLVIPGLLALLAAAAMPAEEPKIPPAPENHVLDQAKVLTPEITNRLTGALNAAAKDEDLHVFVVTVRSVEKGKLEMMGSLLTKGWTKDKVGAVLCFDDEMGWLTVGTSELADEQFSSVVLNMVLRDPLLQGRRKGMSRDKLERAAMTVIEGFRGLKAQAARNDRRQKIAGLAMASLVLGVVVLGALSFFSRGGKAETK